MVEVGHDPTEESDDDEADRGERWRAGASSWWCLSRGRCGVSKGHDNRLP